MLSAPDFQAKQILFVLLSRGDKLSFKNDNIVIRDSENTIKHQSSCYRLFAVFLVGHLSVTSGLLQRAKRFGFGLHLLNHNLKHYGSFLCEAEGNVLLRQKQYEYVGLEIAQHLVANKLDQQIAALKKRRNKTDATKSAIRNLCEYRGQLPDGSLTLQQILGIEGIASRVYFSQMFFNWKWAGRKPRVKHDINNLLLDIGYTLLFNILDSLLHLYGFDVYQGVYHQVFYQRKSLVCDLVEPFRPLIDQQIVKAWALGQIKEKDFEYRGSQYRLFGEPSKFYSGMFLKTLLSEKDEIFSYVQQYYRAFIRDKPVSEFPVYGD